MNIFVDHVNGEFTYYNGAHEPMLREDIVCEHDDRYWWSPRAIEAVEEHGRNNGID